MHAPSHCGSVFPLSMQTALQRSERCRVVKSAPRSSLFCSGLVRSEKNSPQEILQTSRVLSACDTKMKSHYSKPNLKTLHNPTATIRQCSGAWTVGFKTEKAKLKFGATLTQVPHILVKCNIVNICLAPMLLHHCHLRKR